MVALIKPTKIGHFNEKIRLFDIISYYINKFFELNTFAENRTTKILNNPH